ncbi:hypothetical protein, partial [Cedecea davisae]|uniref:hypothetical protein n=1 Tax=Cedecea davisae TaxID=158484 RepID=UPI00242BD5C3
CKSAVIDFEGSNPSPATISQKKIFRSVKYSHIPTRQDEKLRPNQKYEPGNQARNSSITSQH